jgi:hypothetical protein
MLFRALLLHASNQQSVSDFVAVLGEFVGTTLFLFLAFAGAIVANVGAHESTANTTTNETIGFSPIANLYGAISFGFSLMDQCMDILSGKRRAVR